MTGSTDLVRLWVTVGAHYYTNGDRYEGEWRDDQRDGQGEACGEVRDF